MKVMPLGAVIFKFMKSVEMTRLCRNWRAGSATICRDAK